MRLVHQRPGDHETLLHALGIGLNLILAAVGQADAAQQRYGVEGFDTEKPRKKAEVLNGRHLLVEIRRFETHPNMPLHTLDVFRDIHAQKHGPAAFGFHLAGEHLYRRRLAGPVRTQES